MGDPYLYFEIFNESSLVLESPPSTSASPPHLSYQHLASTSHSYISHFFLSPLAAPHAISTPTPTAPFTSLLPTPPQPTLYNPSDIASDF